MDEDSGIVKVSYRSIIDNQGGYKILNEGQRVEFEIIRTKKGLTAINVIRLRRRPRAVKVSPGMNASTDLS